MPNTERSRVVLILAQSPAQETVGQTRLAGPLTSQHDNLPPEDTVQLLLPPLYIALVLRRWGLVDSVGTVQSLPPSLSRKGSTAGGGGGGGDSQHTGQ